MDRLAGGKSHRPRGAAGAHSAHKAGAGPLAPAPALVLRALWARKTPPPPADPLRGPASPRQRIPVGITAVAHGKQEGWDGRVGAAAGRCAP